MDIKQLVQDYYTIKINDEFEEVILAKKEHERIGSLINSYCKEKGIDEITFEHEGQEVKMIFKKVIKKTVVNIDLVPITNIKETIIYVKQFSTEE